ncbi:MAG TPA: hypothetical protein VIK99_03200, partial [Thermaerobacter sp.]
MVRNGHTTPAMANRNLVERLTREIHTASARLGAYLDGWAVDRATMEPLPHGLDETTRRLAALLGHASDLHIRHLRLPGQVRVAVAVIDGLADDELIHRFVLVPLARVPTGLDTPEKVVRW